MSINGIIKKLIIRIYDFNKKRLLNRKIKEIVSFQNRKMNMVSPPSDVLRDHVKLWKSLTNRVNPDWLKAYGNISGLWDMRYIPESLYYNIVEPVLNNKSFSKCYTDKNFYSVVLDEFKRPETLLSNINGVFYSSNGDFITTEEAVAGVKRLRSFIIKPAVDSGGGKAVSLMSAMNEGFISDSGEYCEAEKLFSRYGKDFIIQEVIEQHPYYARYNATSLNTVRVLTYRSCKDEKIHILHIVLRVGAKGKITDNQASGGYACGINDDGSLSGYAVDKHGNTYNEINGNPLVKGEKPFGIDIIKETALRIAPLFHYSRLIGMDLCIDQKGACRVIEINNINNEINFFQMTRGPLFGEFTEEVINFCRGNKRSFMIDFEI